MFAVLKFTNDIIFRYFIKNNLAIKMENIVKRL
jgi:hypothetical protein